jgi:hypothetical protein
MALTRPTGDPAHELSTLPFFYRQAIKLIKFKSLKLNKLFEINLLSICLIGLSGYTTLSLGVSPAKAYIIVDQAPTYEATASQIFSDAPEYSSFGFDDFTTTQSFDLTSLLIYGIESGDPSLNTAVTASLWASPGVTGTPLYSFSGSEINPNLKFDLTGTRLLPGTYWLSAYVTRPLSGQWFWSASSAISGAPAAWQNPGGGFGLGTSVIFSPDFPLDEPGESSFAFKLEGNPVSVPGPLPALGVFAGFAASRRLRARIRNTKAASLSESDEMTKIL